MSEPFKIQEVSLGSDVSDLFRNLERIKTNKPYEYPSLNPNGDPYADYQTAQEIVNAFANSHPKSLEILDQRVDDFYGINKDPNKDKPQIYTEVKEIIQKLLKENK
jgi:hypothetical protein